MLKFVLIAGLLTGCTATGPAAARAMAPTLVLGPSLPAAQERLQAQDVAAVTLLAPTERLPRSGTWTVTWTAGELSSTETVDLAFEADGAVVVSDGTSNHKTPEAWKADDHVNFEGLVHRELTVNNTFSRERFDLRMVSDVELHGTRAVRVNFRWVNLETRATFMGPLHKVGTAEAGA